jgi:hypothetical protein
MHRWPALIFAGLAVFSAAASCKSKGVALSVDLRTDYVPGREIGDIVTEVAPDGSGAQSVNHPISSGEKQFVEGTRIADFGDLPSGNISVKVKVLSPDGSQLVERVARLSISGDYALTMVISRNCEGIVCPEPGGDTFASTCDRGKCVRPECTVVTTKFCAPPECSKDDDCKTDVACVEPHCTLGTCLFLPNDSKCKPGQTCDVARGCFPPDTGSCTASSSTELNCGDGVDDDCDGKTDCADADCAGKTCEDGDKCTEGDTCTDGACKPGTKKSCDDGNPCTLDGECADGSCPTPTPNPCDDMNPCTTDSCDMATGCAHVNNTEPCNDGTFCNGADTCKDGTCSVHAGNPCGKVCDEASSACVGCIVDRDCGPVTYGTYSTCVGATTCATTGTHTRSVTTPKCTANVCSNVVTMETTACPIVSDGKTCAATVTPGWPACPYLNACDTSATRTRTVTSYTCSAGTCKANPMVQSDTCTRTVAQGTSCGSGKYCCSGSCVAKNSNAHCSSCGIDCGTGSSCVSIGGGQYSCTCSSNAQCQTWGFGSGATCWSPSGQTVCNCQCTTANCCKGGADCFKPSGINYCSY